MQGILAWTIWTGTFTWLVYMALEPYVRRKVPHTLIAWNRLLAGRVRDPMVGRDVLIGALAGAGLFSATLLQGILPPWFGAPVPAPLEGNTSSLASARHVAFYLIDNVRYFTSWNLELMFMFVVFFALFRRYWLAVALTSLVFVTVFQPVPLPGAPRSLVLAASGLGVALILYILLRWGLLAAGAMGVVFGWLSASPLTLDTTSWYAGRSYFVLAVCSTLAIYGFVVSLGGRPMFGRPLFEE